MSTEPARWAVSSTGMFGAGRGHGGPPLGPETLVLPPHLRRGARSFLQTLLRAARAALVRWHARFTGHAQRPWRWRVRLVDLPTPLHARRRIPFSGELPAHRKGMARVGAFAEAILPVIRDTQARRGERLVPGQGLHDS
jgi:hypothetical protein